MDFRGVVYVAVSDKKYLEAALISAFCFREKNLSIPITIISDLNVLNFLNLEEYGIFPRLLSVDDHVATPFFSRHIKTQIYQYSPYTQTLYLDADILQIGDVSQIWNYLDQANLAIAKDRLPEIHQCDHIGAPEIEFTIQQIPKDFPHYNSGVMLWRNTEDVQLLFAKWHQEWCRFQQQDQLALARAIAATQIPISVMPNTFNISPRDAEPLINQGKDIHFLHCWGKVTNDRFKRLSMRYCPEAVKRVETLWDRATTIGLSSL
jgi:Glycosyl transferase family 8